MSDHEDMRGPMEEENDLLYYCQNCKEWYSYDKMYNDRICEKCYYKEL